MKNKEKISSFQDGSLRGDSYRSNNVNDLLDDDYDLAIFVSSWEERCLCFSEAESWSTDTVLLVLFDDSDKAGFREKHDAILSSRLIQRSRNLEIISGRSIDIDTVWDTILSQVFSAFEKKQRPLKILLDLTTCPRFYALAIVGACMTEGIASVVSVAYAEACYAKQEPKKSELEEITFTDGHWKAVAIPFYEGTYSPTKTRFYLVSVGFEGWKTLRVVSRSDPDRVSVLFPAPGFLPQYEEHTKCENEVLIRQYCIPDEQIINAPAGDAVGTWSFLTKANLERTESENTYYLCCGTKPHSLALGLRALVLGNPAVLYNLPQEHRVLPVTSSGTFWRFDIRSLTVMDSAKG